VDAIACTHWADGRQGGGSAGARGDGAGAQA
jgi:hypothetical protein